MHSEIVVVASCNVDLISYVKRFPFIGETVRGLKFETGFGGKGGNEAVVCARLGSNVATISMLGSDYFGQAYLKNLKDNKINTEHVFITDKAKNGVAQICVDEYGDNTIVVVLGANLMLTPNELKACDKLIKDSKFLITNLELPYDTVLKSLEIAKENNVTTVLNFSPVISNYKEELWENTDILVINEVELEELTKIEIKSVYHAKDACNLLIDKLYHIKIGIICSLGSSGVLYIDRKTKNLYHKAVEKNVKVIDTTGAGDAFTGALVHYLNKYGLNSINKAIDLAADYATLTVQTLGIQSSYPSILELDERFK